MQDGRAVWGVRVYVGREGLLPDWGSQEAKSGEKDSPWERGHWWDRRGIKYRGLIK